MKELKKKDPGQTILSEVEFVRKCKELVSDWYNYHGEPYERVYSYNVYCVWLCKILKNNKGLFSTDRPDSMYFEITFDGNAKKFYLDAYKKTENKVIDL